MGEIFNYLFKQIPFSRKREKNVVNKEKPAGKLIRKNTGTTCKVANYILRFMLAAYHGRV